MKKIVNFILSHKVLFLILLLGLFFRTAYSFKLFAYGHDQDLAGWFVRDVVENYHLRLIGQETSVHGVFIGPVWYYSLVPFYLLFGMSPASGLAVSVIIGLITIFSIWFVVGRVFSKSTGLFSALIYSSSFLLFMTDREVNPTITVVLWSVWFLYSLHLLFSKQTRAGLVLTAFMFGFSWQINLALLILAPVSIVAIFITQKVPRIAHIRDSALAFLLTLSPFILFELKNGFLQTSAVLTSALGKGETVNFIEKFDRTTTLLSKNIRGIYTGDFLTLPDKIPMLVMLFIFVSLVIYRKLRIYWAIVFSLWIALYVVFFSRNPLNLSEYYLNGMNILWVVIPSLVLSLMWQHKNLKWIAFVLVGIFVLSNFIRFTTIPVNNSGFVHRSKVVLEIINDSHKHNYPCVSVSYITTPGNDLGYRYLFYYNGLKVNLPKTNAPVYTIVFPHTLVDKIDASFGALGLIYPDYKKYTTDGVKESCAGRNQNLTEPMFGFTN